MAIETLLGRRDQNKADKRSRIEAAAAELFFERGYSGVSTLALAERAGVAAGTVFRYASSKPELFLMSYNVQFAQAINEGTRVADAELAAAPAQPDGGITTLVLQIFERARQMPENASVYQRELMFGDAGTEFRQKGLALVLDLQQRLAGRLQHAARGCGRSVDDQVLRAGADAIFACLHAAVARLGNEDDPQNRSDRASITSELETQVRLLVAGAIAQGSHHDNGRTVRSVERPTPMTTT